MLSQFNNIQYNKIMSSKSRAIQAAASMAMFAMVPIAGCTIISRPMGQLVTKVGDYHDILDARYSHIPGIQGSPISMGNCSADALATPAGLTATDLAGIIRLATARTAIKPLNTEVWGIKHDVRYGNNSVTSTFTCVITPVFRDITTGTLTADTASAQTFIVTPNLGANSSLEFFTFMTRPAVSLGYNATDRQFDTVAVQGSYAASPWALAQLTNGGTAAAIAGAASSVLAGTMIYEGIAVSYQSQSTITQSASIIPIVGCYDSVAAFNALLG